MVNAGWGRPRCRPGTRPSDGYKRWGRGRQRRTSGVWGHRRRRRPRSSGGRHRRRFRFDSLAPGDHTVKVRSIGFTPFSATVRLAAGIADARITLSTSTYRLPEIVVRTRSSRLEETGFYRRQAEFRRGRFLEGDSLIRLDSLNLPLALSRIGGFHLKSAGTLDSGVASPACRKGFRLWVNGWEVSDSTDNAFYFRTINPDEIAGLEIYEDGTPPLVFTRHEPKQCALAVWER